MFYMELERLRIDLEQQLFVNFELSMRMKELGYPQESLFVYRHWRQVGQVIIDLKKDKWFDYPKYRKMPPTTGFLCAAPTASEIGERLPDHLGEIVGAALNKQWLTCKKVGLWEIGYENHDSPSFEDDSEADARAKMWIYLKENNLIHDVLKV